MVLKLSVDSLKQTTPDIFEISYEKKIIIQMVRCYFNYEKWTELLKESIFFAHKETIVFLIIIIINFCSFVWEVGERRNTFLFQVK